MDVTIKAPQISHYIEILSDGRYSFDNATTEYIDKIFVQVHKVAPCGDNNRRELWLKAERGTIEDYGDFEEYKADDVVETREEFEELWTGEFPDEEYWYKLVTIEYDDYRAIFLGRELIYQSKIYAGSMLCRYSTKELFMWLEKAIEDCIEKLKSGTYNTYVSEKLSVRQRTGTILRKDYWEIFPDEKESYLSDISDEETELFIKNIKGQVDNQPIGKYISEMTANKFYEFCAIGYKANNYDKLEGLSPKEQYYKQADGRDDDLSKIDPDSSHDFDLWYKNMSNFTGHPWEVCRGGNSTHIDLYVFHNEKGYYLGLGGKSWARSIETIKFYNALRAEGVAVYLYGAKAITNRLLAQDRIGIVPQGVMPAYCGSYFPDMDIVDFINLPFEKEIYEKMLPKIVWIEEIKQKLI